MTSPSFRSVGGSIVWRGKFITDQEANRQADLALAEVNECRRIGDKHAARIARRLYLEIEDALKAQADWARCTRVAA